MCLISHAWLAGRDTVESSRSEISQKVSIQFQEVHRRVPCSSCRKGEEEVISCHVPERLEAFILYWKGKVPL